MLIDNGLLHSSGPVVTQANTSRVSVISTNEIADAPIIPSTIVSLGQGEQPSLTYENLKRSVVQPGAEVEKATTEQEQANAKQEKVQETKEQKIEQEQIKQLSARDREVRAHEQAHAAVGGQHAGAPSYQFQRGPDGVNYAVGGEVSIDTSPVAGDPQATLQKASQIRRAALAPAEPSAQDRKVAALASQMELQALLEIAQERDDKIAQADALRQSSVSNDANSEDGENPITPKSPGNFTNLIQ